MVNDTLYKKTVRPCLCRQAGRNPNRTGKLFYEMPFQRKGVWNSDQLHGVVRATMHDARAITYKVKSVTHDGRAKVYGRLKKSFLAES